MDPHGIRHFPESIMFRRDFLLASSVVAASSVSFGGSSGAGGAPSRPLSVFDSISLDGYFTDGSGDTSWAHSRDPEWQRFSAENAGGEAELLFGRKTYDMMASFWPSPQAMQAMPDVARGMNRMRKTVFSRTLEKADWENTRVVKGDLGVEVARMKQEPGPGMVILGSGQIVAQLTQAGLVDSYQIVIVPILLGKGRSLFEGVTGKPRLKLTKTRAFGNGNVVMWYEKSLS
jgi:dihydrofolate reductase